MRKRILTALTLMSLMATGVVAQRHSDLLDRSIVAIKVTDGVYVNWRMSGEEYYDVAWNLYRDGTKLNDTPLKVSNYQDKGGSTSSTYTVKAVVRGVEEAEASTAASVWENNWLEIPVSKGHGDLTSTYIPNDACCADLDGDGQLDILLKYDNRSDALTGYTPGGYNGEYVIMEALKLDGTRLWWIDMGPNMADFQNNEQNIVAFDWDEDGKAEAVLRTSEGTKIHYADGRVYTFNTTLAKSGVGVSDDFKNYRASSSSGQWFIHDGSEFLVYLNGETGEVYDAIDYPNKRLEDNETDLNKAWGDGYGHRSTKHFFGAPFLDGKKPSIFLARGIYTRHKMTALDVDPSTHKMSIRWQWNCNTDRGDSADDWFGNGYHNFGIADVDWDGRDEIVYGSMVIDDNGLGLHTTGLGHGDAQHCSDFDPYTHGHEIFAALEDHPGNNFRDATTGKIYYRYVAGEDDGRAMMGNFSNSVLGAQGISSRDPNVIGAVARGPVASMTKSNITQNFRIYWDGDLLEETFDYTNGKDTEGGIWKYGAGLIATMTGSKTNNDTKGTPCYQGDILGDWREEIIMRTDDNNIRIYTTSDYTPWRIYSLWHDHQYRQSMVWQMCGYNQPPHKSYFLGELEGMTVAPPPLTTTGRTILASGETLSSAQDDKHVLLAETKDAKLNISGTASPYILTLNAPTWVQGHDDNDNITTTVYTLELAGKGTLAGDARLVKQGDGILSISDSVELKHAGETSIWGGTLNYNGDIPNSSIWANRFVTLNLAGNMSKNVSLEYASQLCPGGQNKADSIVIADTLSLNYGAALSIDIADSTHTDYVQAKVLKLSVFKGNATGLAYSTPAIRFNITTDDGTLPGGKYAIGKFDTVDGDISSVVVEGSVLQKLSLSYEDGVLYLNVPFTRHKTAIKWVGDESNIWETSNLESNLNFEILATGEKTYFVSGDTVIFNDDAKNFNVVVNEAVNPGLVTFDNSSSAYNLSGESIIGGSIVKKGTGKLTIGEMYSSFTGGTTIEDGSVAVSNLAYSSGTEDGALGNLASPITLNGGTLTTNGAVNCSNQIRIGENGGTVNANNNLLLTKAVVCSLTNANWYKTGNGTMTLSRTLNEGQLHVVQGSIQAAETPSGLQSYPSTIYFEGGSIKDANSSYSYTTSKTNFVVEEGQEGTWTLDGRCTYTGTLSGTGRLTINPTYTRSYMEGDWSSFAGTITIANGNEIDFAHSAGLPNARLNLLGTAKCYEDGGKISLSKFYVGSITGSGTLQGTKSTIIVGSDNTDCTFSGSVNNATYDKNGTGILTLTKPQTTSGDIYVRAGILCLEPSTDNDLTTNFFNQTIRIVNTGASLMGNATVGTVYIQNGGTIAPGKCSTTTKTKAINAENIFSFGGNMTFCMRNGTNKETSRSYVTCTKSLTLDSESSITVTLETGYTPKAGDYAILFTAKEVSFASGVTVNLPALPDGLAWDTTDLLKENGVLRVVATETALPTIARNEEVTCSVYDLAGRKLSSFKALRKDVEATVAKEAQRSGIYIVLMNSASATESTKVRVKK